MTAEADDGAPAPSAPARRVGAWDVAARLVYSAPDLLTVALAALSTVAIVALVTGRFEPVVVLPIGGVAAVVAMIVLRPERRTVTRTDLIPLGLVLAGMIVSTYVAMRLSGEFVLATRDPGTYALSGRWLYDHHELVVPFHPADFGSVAGLDPTSLGFGVTNGSVYAQGYHLLPALLAIGAWLVRDPSFVLDGNPLIGGLALLVLYGFARRVVGPWWALVPTTVLAVSMPFIAFSRDPYTEPLALVLAFGAMSILWRAIESRRVSEFVLGGLVAGAGSMARVDAYVTVLGIAAGAAIFLIVAQRGDRWPSALRLGAIAVGAVLPIVLGLIDVRTLSAIYYRANLGEIKEVMAAGAALVCLTAVVCALAWWTRLGAWVHAHREALGWVAGGLVVAVFAVLASRPLWFVAYNNNPPGFASLASFQHALGLPVDERRSYDELTVSWMAWYHGWPTVILGVVGLGLLVRTLLRTADARLGFLLAAVLGTGVIYLNKATIFPDQVWAMRRFLPVFIPGLLIAGTVALVALARRRSLRLVAVALALVMVGWTAYVTHPMVRVPSFRPQLAEVETVCNALPANAEVLMVDGGGQSRGTSQMSFRAFCGVPVVGLDDPDAATLGRAAAAAASNGRTLYVASLDPTTVPWRTVPTAPWLSTEVIKWSEQLLRPPSGGNLSIQSLYLGIVGADGLVDSAPPPPDATLDPNDAPPSPS